MTDKVEIKQTDKENAVEVEFMKLYSEAIDLFDGPICDFKTIECEDFDYSVKFFNLVSKASAAKKKFASIKYDGYNDIKEEHKRFYKRVNIIDYMCSVVCEYMMNNTDIRPEIGHIPRMTHVCTIMYYLRKIMVDYGLYPITADGPNRLINNIQGILSLYIKNNLIIDEIKDRLINIANYRE